MTYQRAVVNCRRCLELFQTYQTIRNPEVSTARNEAMKALEEMFNANALPGKYDLPAKNSMERNVEVTRALDACMNCDFKTANIAEIFQPTENKKRV